MADLPPHYDETTASIVDELPAYNDSLTTPTPLKIYLLTRHSAKSASLTLTSPPLDSLHPPQAYTSSYEITYNPPPRPFAKPLPDILIAYTPGIAISFVSLPPSHIASATFDSTTSGTTINYPPNDQIGTAETTVPILLQSALMREYSTQIAGKPFLILPASRNDLLLVESRALQGAPWARFRASNPPSPPPFSQTETNPVSTPKRSLLPKLFSKSQSPSPEKRQEGEPAGVNARNGQELGVLEIFRADLDQGTRDQIVCVLVTVVERAQRMRVRAGKEKSHLACGYACAAMMVP